MTTYASENLTDILALAPEAQDLLFRQARTANTFTDEPVGDEQVAAIYDLVKWAPTSMNTQPLRVLLVRSDEARARLLEHMAPGNKVKTGSAPLVAVLSADHSFHEHLHRTFPHFPGAKDVFASEDTRAGTATLNATLQAAYFLIGVRAAGLAAGPMTGYDAAGIDAEFFAGTDQRVVAVVNIGHPGDNPWFERSPRLELDEVVSTV